MENKIDLVIIGAGIAGVSAAVYAKRSGLDFLIFDAGTVGGQLLFMEEIDNYIGLSLGTKGRDLAERLATALSDLDISVLNEEIVEVNIDNGEIVLRARNSVYLAKGGIVAVGASFGKLGVKGEKEFGGKGVSYCAVCDGFFFKGKNVAVIGGGNTAVEEALYLSEIAKKVTLIHRRDKLRALDYLQKKLFDKNNIEVILNSKIEEIKGANLLEEIVIKNLDNSRIKSLSLQGVFIAVGMKPNTEMFRNILSMDDKGFITSDENMKSSRDFIWACGDCRKRPLKQLITAASEGAIASISAYKYLKGQYISS